MRATTTFVSTALLAGLATATSSYFPPSLGYFFLDVPIPESDGSGVTEQLVNANGGRFYYGKATAASDAAADGSKCPTNTYTTFLVSAPTLDGNSTGVTSAFLNTYGYTANAKQQVYCSTTSGQLLYTPPGELLPTDNAASPNFTYTPQAGATAFGGFTTDGGFSLCDAGDGAQQLYCTEYIPDGTTCTEVFVATRNWYGGISAGQYD